MKKMSENSETRLQPLAEQREPEPAVEVPAKDSAVSRRKALISALLAGGLFGAGQAKAAASCECLPAPDCNAVCPNGGTPRGDGTQACECIEIPTNMPPRALARVDGGDAINSEKTNGYQIRGNSYGSGSQILVFNGSYIDYIDKSDIAGSLPVIGAKVLYGDSILEDTTTRPNYRYNVQATEPAVKRDKYGRVEAVGVHRYWKQCNCDCNCCNCGDDSGCFIKARLLTTKGPKNIEEIRVGDRLIGIDGVHPVVGIATNVLASRKALSPKDHPALVLTQEHIILSGNTAVVAGVEEYQLNKTVLTAENGVRGVYAEDWMDCLCRVDPVAFEEVPADAQTKTYTPIVASGHWGMTEDGVSVLLCRVVGCEE